jgi:hypothetical protein
MKNLLEELSPEARRKLVEKQNRRLQSSSKYYDGYFAKWKTFYKLYHSLKDDAGDSEEPNILVPMAYGIVEDAVSRLVVPFLQKLPINVRAKVAKYATNAEKYYNACKEYFGGYEYRLDRIASEREYVITGCAWEIYGWCNEWLKGKEWKEQEVEEEIEYPVSIMGKIVQKVKALVGINKTLEVEKEYPERIGFQTRFPSIFAMFPEPGVKKFARMSWVIEAEGTVSIADLEKEIYVDPETREKKPLYDLTELLASVDGKKDKIHPEVPAGAIPGEDISAIISGRDAATEGNSDEPSVFITRVYQKDNTILTIANGKFLIHAIADVYHYPVMPLQLRVYTQDKENLFGTGIIEPILELLFEVNDIHNMSFQNWIRSINKMVVYDESVIKYPNDFTPRAGGKIRANLLAGGNVNHAFGVVDQPDVSASMINMESQVMGKIEKTISISDLTPGAMGTKAYHKTYGGLMEIQSSFARRFSIMAMTELAYLTRQMEIMYWMFQQFMFNDMPVGVMKEGVFRAETYRREDFSSGGQGFMYVQSNDPSFGDSAVQRNQLMVLMDQALKYEQFRLTAKDPSMMRAAVDKIFKLSLESFGVQDTNAILALPDGVLTPEQEFDMLLQGMPVQVNPRENFMQHIIKHVQQRNEPDMIAGIASGAVAPELMAALDNHINETMQMVQLFMDNIDQVAMAKQAEDTMKEDGGADGPGPTGLNLQNNPAPTGPSDTANVPSGGNNGAGSGQMEE